MKRVFRALVILFVVLLAAVLLLKGTQSATSWSDPINQFRRALSDRHESKSDADWFGDYTRNITGRIEVSQIDKIVQLLELKKADDGVLPETVRWCVNPEEEWWTLPDDFDSLYYNDGSGWFEILGFRGDKAYYEYVSW